MKRRKLKYIVNDISYLMGFVFMASIAGMDSEKIWIPMLSMFVSGAWLMLHGLILDAKRDARERRRKCYH